MLFTKPILATILACGLAAPAVACEPDFTSQSKAKRADTPIELKADCSFRDVDAGHLDSFWATQTMTGNSVRDRGNGRVAQVVGTSGLCSYEEVLLFVDCNADESLIISGKGTPPRDYEVAGLSENRVETIQPPYGPIKIGPQSTVSGLAKVAKKHGISTTSPAEYFGKPSPHESYDPTCGCKLCYPKSRAAPQPLQ